MELADKQRRLQEITVEDINDVYRSGKITAKQKNDLIREKAHATVAGTLEHDGYLMGIVSRTVEHLTHGWDNLKEALIRDPTDSVKTEAYYAGLAVWGQIEMASSLFSAIGEMTGQVAENVALKAGAPPGLARAINIATDIGTGFIPIGLAAKSTAKTVQHVAKATTSTKPIVNAQQVVNGLAAGLEVSGIANAGTVLANAAKAAGHAVATPVVAAAAMKTVKTVKDQFLEDLIKYRDEITKITATKTHEETAAIADKLGLTVDDLKNVTPGQALNENEVLAYLKALDPHIDKLRTLSQAVVDTKSQQSIDDLAKHASELFTVSPIFRGAEVTAGRSVEILKESPPMKKITNMMAGWDPESIAKGDFNGAVFTLADDIIAMTDPGKLKAATVLNQNLFARFSDSGWPMMREAYVNLLLSRPLTWVRNATGNSIAASNAVLDNFAGSIFSADKTGGVAFGESAYLVKGMSHAIRDGMRAFANAFDRTSGQSAGRLDYVPHRIPGVAGRIINGPSDVVRGMDEFFKTILTRASYYSEAFRDGTHKGLSGDALGDFVSRRVNNPTDAMRENAAAFSTHGTFQDDLGTFGKAAQRLLQAGPLALYFPFMKTPINLAKYAWNRTPGLQFLSHSLYQDILEGGAKADMAIGRLTMSNLQGMFLFDLAQEGLITGSGPTDPQLRDSWLVKNQPYSIATQHGWVPIAGTEPASTVFGLMADFSQIMNQLDEPSAGQAGMAMSFSIMKNLVDKSYWKTVGDIIDLTSSVSHGHEPGTYVQKISTNPLATAITLGPLVAATAKAIDPVVRDTRSFLDILQAKIPNYSKDLPAVRDGYGHKVLYPQTVGGPWLSFISPLTYHKNTDDPVLLEGSRLSAKTPKFEDHMGGNISLDMDIREVLPGDKIGVQLSATQRGRWQEIYKNILYHPELGIQPRLLNTEQYQLAPLALQRQQFIGFLNDAKSMAKDALLVEHPDLHKQIINQNASDLKPFLDAGQQQELTQQVQESIDLLNELTPGQQDNLLRWGVFSHEDDAAIISGE